MFRGWYITKLTWKKGEGFNLVIPSKINFNLGYEPEPLSALFNINIIQAAHITLNSRVVTFKKKSNKVTLMAHRI